MNVFSCLDRAATRFPDRIGTYLGTEPVAGFRAIRDRALALGSGLAARWPVGARIAIVAENDPDLVPVFFGIWAAGQVAVPVNAKLHPREIAAILADSDAAVVVASPKRAAALAEAELDAALPPIRALGSDAYEALFAGPPVAARAVDPDAVAWLFYTSGTTGRSKGAMLTHRNLLAMSTAHLADLDDPDERGCLIHGAPMSHGSGLYMLPYTARGAAQVIPASGGFDAGEFLDLCDAHKGCAAFLAPTMVQRIRRAAEARGRPPRNLRSVTYGGGPMYVEELKAALAVFGPVFSQLYGQGEAPMTITGMSRRDHVGVPDAVLGSAGWVRSGVEMRVVDEAGRPLPVGGIGEIVCRGDVVMPGYWNNPDATAQAIRDGWLYTGDVGSVDATGCLTLRDRSKDVVISGGTNIYPREIEEVLLTHPGVDDVCVIGAPDPDWGEIVVAFVVRGPGAAPSPEELDAHCLTQLARFKRPKTYRFVADLPKSSYGKVLKRELRLLHAAEPA